VKPVRQERNSTIEIGAGFASATFPPTVTNAESPGKNVASRQSLTSASGGGEQDQRHAASPKA